jgi:hypothetical protein
MNKNYTSYRIVIALDRVTYIQGLIQHKIFQIYILDIRGLTYDLPYFTMVNRITSTQMGMLNFKYRKFK